MFKRANKTTALLLAAAAVVSLVPATGANAAAKRLGVKDGTVKEGIAYDNSKYGYYGYRDKDNDATGIYYNNGGDAKDTTDSDFEDYRFDTVSKYGTKYAYAHEQSNDDEYLIDLSTGKKVDDETKQERRDKAEDELISKVKKADRYNGTDDASKDWSLVDFNQILEGQFGEVWYKYTAHGDKVESTNAATNPQIKVSVLSSDEFKAKADASVVGTGFSGNVAGEDFTYVASGNVKSDKTDAEKVTMAYYTADGEKKPYDVNKITIKNLATTGASAEAVEYNAPTVAVISTSGNTTTTVNANLEGGSVKTALDNIIAEYDAYVRANLVETKVPADVYAKSGKNTYALFAATDKPTADEINVKKTALDAEVAKVNKEIKETLTDAKTDYGNAGGTIIQSYAAYKTFVTDTITKKLGKYVADFDSVTIVPESSYVTLNYKNGASIDSAKEREVLADQFGSAFSDAQSASSNLNKFYGFANEDGTKYVDASYYANIKAFSQTKGRAVKIEKFDDEDKDAGLTAHLDAIDAVAQDKDNIYAIATVTLTGAGVPDGHATQHYLQKISKAQGDKEDGAYTPKDTTSYLLDEGIYKEGDLQKAYKIITGQDCEGADEHEYLLGMTVKGSDLYVTRSSEDNVKVYKFNLKSNYKSDVAAGKNLVTDVDTSAVKWDDAKDEDINKFTTSDAQEDEGLKGITEVKDAGDSKAEQVELFGQKLWRHPSVSIDVNGNTWSVKDNEVTKFDGLDKKNDIYSVDGDFDAIDVYDDNNLIAWDTDGDHYTTVKEGQAVTEGDAINVNPDINKNKFKNGYDATEKKFYKDGTAVVNDWASDQTGKWYLLGADGTALTGWQQKNGQGAWYYLDPQTGAMTTGWQQLGGVWYYLNPVNSAGNMLTGWFQDANGTWYYADTNGHMLADTTVDGYVLGSNGAWVQ